MDSFIDWVFFIFSILGCGINSERNNFLLRLVSGRKQLPHSVGLPDRPPSFLRTFDRQLTTHFGRSTKLPKD